jgi:biotin carboxyl carrier protein
MTGRVVSVAAKAGTEAREGDLLLTVEAMKMEFKLVAPEDGTVLEVACADGDRVELGQLLVRLRPAFTNGGAA